MLPRSYQQSPPSSSIVMKSEEAQLHSEGVTTNRANVEGISVSLPSEWESNILQLIPRAERSERSELIDSLLSDARGTYANIARTIDGSNDAGKETFVQKRSTETSETYVEVKKSEVRVDRQRFAMQREILAKKFLLAEDVIRSIVSMAQLELPTVICELERYKATGPMPLNELRKMFLRDVRRGTMTITGRYCKEVAEKCAARRIDLSDLRPNRISQIVRCATHVFSQQIIGVAIRSMERVVSVVEEGRDCPEVEFRLVCKHDHLTVEPSVEEVSAVYRDLLTNIENVAPEEAMMVGKWLRGEDRMRRTKGKCVLAKPPEWFVKQAHERLRTAVETSFVSLRSHVNRITDRFSNVLERQTVDVEAAKASLSLEWMTREKLNACEAYMARYVACAREASALLSYVRFQVGRLDQSTAKECLKEHCLQVTDRSAGRLVRHHREWNEDVCLQFENLRNKALNVPKDAKSLISLSEYVSRVAESRTRELTERARKSTYLLGTLLRLTVLTDEHMELNRRTINWPRLIEPVLAKSNSLCEAMKSELEDEMQRRITAMNAAVDELFPRLVVMNDMDDLERVGEYVEHYTELTSRMASISRQVESINEEERLFRFPETAFPKVDELREIVVPFDVLIRTVHRWQRDRAVWLDGPFESLHAEIVSEKTIRYKEQLTEMSQSFKRRIKADAAVGSGGKVFKFSGVADDPDPMQQPAPLKLSWQALRRVDEFKAYLPLIVCVCNPALTERHWREMSAIAGFDLTPNAGTTLRKMIELDLMDDIKRYEAISVGANKELDLQRRLKGMVDEWNLVSFEATFESSTKLFVNQNEIESLLEDQLVKIDEMRASHFVEPILPSVTKLRATLLAIQELTVEWESAQLRKLSLNSIFSQSDTVRTWPDSLKFGVNLYNQLNDSLESVRQKLSENPTLQGIGDVSSWTLKELNEVSERLDNVEEGARRYLNEKRTSFGRLFFLSDAEVRSVLFPRVNDNVSDNKCPACPNECFPGIRRLLIEKDQRVRGIIGKYGETICFRRSLPTNTSQNHPEEEWLVQLDKELTLIVREFTQRRILDGFDDKSLKDIINHEFPSMTTILALRVHWTCDIENCLSPTVNINRLRDVCTHHQKRLAVLIDELRTKRTDSSQLSRAERKFLSTLIVLTFDQADATKSLVEHGNDTIDKDDFLWTSQPRYYYLENDDLVIASIFDANLEYGYEYDYYETGVIRTSLTDRCVRSLTQAYRYGLHSAIIGPSGTGKSETLKTLTKDLALLRHDFDCACESISYDDISRTFKGFIACAAWLCLENLNRLPAETLSVVSQEIVNISGGIRALLAGKQTASHRNRGNGCEMKMGNVCCVICVNPSTKNRRFELPDNLRTFFRTVTMSAPDLKRMAEIELLAGGFRDANLLASKLHATYELLAERLPRRRLTVYAFDTRSARAVLRTAVRLKRRFPEEDEGALLIRSLIDTGASKLHDDEDIAIFQDISRHLYPNTILSPPNYDFLLRSVEEACAKRGLRSHELFLLKLIQLFEMTHVSNAIVLIGDPLVGKTEIVRCLADALSISADSSASKRYRYRSRTSLHSVVKVEAVVSGAVADDRLFSFFDEKSVLWKDGPCAKALRFAENSDADCVKWLLVDGPLSGSWSETLCNALNKNNDDENASWVLPLPSGERLRAPRSTRIIFETADTSDVSPGFLSRCGIIHVDSRSLDWRPYILSRIRANNIFRDYEDTVYSLFDWVIDPCLQFLREHCTESSSAFGGTVMITQMHRVVSTFSIFEMFVKDACESAQTLSTDHLLIWSQVSLMFAVAWGIGGTLNIDDRQKFDEFSTSLWKGSNERHPVPEIVKRHEVPLPSEGTVRENTYLFKGPGSWKYLGDLAKNGSISVEPRQVGLRSDDFFVPTVDTMKYRELFLRHVQHKVPFLICGRSAAGKSCLMQDLLDNLPEENYSVNQCTLYSTNDAENVQRLLFSRLKRSKKGYYEGPDGKVSVNFFDDLDASTLPRLMTKRKTDCNSASVLELIRQHFDHGYWYDITNDLDKIVVNNALFLASVTTSLMPGSLALCPRFLRHFNVYIVDAPTNTEAVRIFSGVLLSRFKANQASTSVNVNSTDIVNIACSVASATIDVYEFATKSLLPIPSKSQYIFGLRDAARVIAGCGLLHLESIEAKSTFLRLWTHETWRVFGDRIVDDEDKELLFGSIKESARRHFKEPFDGSLEHLSAMRNYEKIEGDDGIKASTAVTKEILGNLMFTNFAESPSSSTASSSPSSSPRRGKYEEVNNLETLRNRVLSFLNEHNRNVQGKQKIDAVISHWTLEQLARITRILATPAGSLLILSGAGSGRRTIARLASYIQGQKMFESAANSYYDSSLWRGELKSALQECGGRGKDAVLFLVESRTNGICLKDVSGLLSTGEVPELFASVDERQTIIEMARLDAQNGDRNAELGTRAILDFFIRRCRRKLHCLICFGDPGQWDSLGSSLTAYPSLMKHCAVNWFVAWPQDALLRIATKHTATAGDVGPKVARAFVHFYSLSNVTSPLKFLHAVKSYDRLAAEKRSEMIAAKNRYLAGLEKLETAARRVEEMKTTLTVLKPQLELSAQQTVETMRKVENENRSVERATRVVKREEEIANKKAEIAGSLKAECEADLAVAIPILEDAVVALNTLKPTDITLVKAMKNPPDTVKLVMAAVCVMLSVPPDRSVNPVTGSKSVDYWGPSKRILGDMNFLQNLREYDKDNIPTSVMQLIKKVYMTDKSFVPKIVAKASSAAEGLCKWVRAMVSYDEVAKAVAPKKEKLAAAQRECDEAEAFLAEKRRTLAALNARLAALNDSLRETLAKKLCLENEVADCTGKLTRAESLIASLGGENDRWMKCVREIETSRDNIAGDTLLSCALVAFTASLRLDVRERLLEEWMTLARKLGVPCSQDYCLTRVLGKRAEIDQWHVSGALSRDRFSTENAIIAKRSRLPCLFIDPQTRANRWIRRLERRNGLTIVALTDPECLVVVNRSIANGRPVLLQNIEETLDTFVLESLLAVCNDANNDNEEQTAFRLYVTTRLPSPPRRLASYILDKLTIVDFTIPEEALRIRLLDIVAAKERPELQERFEQLVAQDAADLGALEQQEENILATLSSTSTDILEDESAIKALDSSKGLSVDIKKRQEAAREMTREIETFRETYIPFSRHCARLFATLNALALLDRMYRFSFRWFVRLYVRSIETSNRSVVLEKRLEFLSSSFRRNLHTSVCDSLRERHKLVYSFLLCTRILMDSDQVTMSEINFFTRSAVATSSQSSSSLLPPKWWPLSNKHWQEMQELTLICPIFASLPSDETIWETFQVDNDSSLLPITRHLQQEPTPFQRLLLSNVISPEKVVTEVFHLTEFVLGSDPSVTDDAGKSELSTISRAYTEASCLTPLLFILPCYSTPASLLTSFASQLGCSSKLRVLSMASGQETRAESLLREAQANGLWLLLENCHLVLPWLAHLDKIRSTTSKDSNNDYNDDDDEDDRDVRNVSLEFRLWLSTHSVPGVPMSLLHDSVKIVCDAPLGLKQTLSRVYRSDPFRRKDFFDGCPGKDRTFSRLLYGLCVFHAIIRERSRFGAQGWSRPYDFDHSDLAWSAVQLQTAVNERDRVPFRELNYLIGECNYGGGMINEFDRECLTHLLSVCCNSLVVDVIAPQGFPQRCEYRDVMRFVEKMPLDPSVEILRSDRNALFVRDAAIAEDFRSDLRAANGANETPSHSNLLGRILSTIDVIDERLPSLKDCEAMCTDARRRRPISFERPLNVTLIQQTDTLKFVVEQARESLRSLRVAYYGGISSMNDGLIEDLEHLVTDLDNGQVPDVWRRSTGVISANLTVFVDAIRRRANFLRRWIDRDTPKVVGLDDFFHCRTIFAAWRLFYSRLNDVSPDKLSLDFRVTSIFKSADEDEENGGDDQDEKSGLDFFIRGLHLIGGRWDVEKVSLVRSVPNVFVSDMPLVRVLGVKRNSARNSQDCCDDRYPCPLYVGTTLRSSVCDRYWENHVTEIPLPASLPRNVCVECRTALFCQVD